MKKKLLICLAMLVCILGLTACGKEEITENSFITKDQAKAAAEAVGESLALTQSMLDQNNLTMSEYVERSGGSLEDAKVIINAMDSWSSAAKEFGNYVSVLSDETEITITEDKVDATVKIQGDKVYKGNKQRTATIEVVMTEKGYDSITVSTDYDMSELMTKAALNTLLGMGTVFAVLILIYGLISCFNFIPKIQKKFQKKPAEAVSAPAPARTVQPAASVEEETDDTELIAVIAAAIAASEGAASADGYVVRSIIRR